MDMTDYAWSFATANSYGKLPDKDKLHNLHTDFKSYLHGLQNSQFYEAASFFSIKAYLYNNGKALLTIVLDKDKFLLKELGTDRAISLEKVYCDTDTIIACLGILQTVDSDKDKYTDLIKELQSAI